MPKITFLLLQTPRILLDDELISLPFKKAEGLLYYMAVKKTITRDEAASVFWSDNDEQTAKKNLRHTLYTIKKAFHLELVVSLQKQTLSLNPELEYRIDYDSFLKEDNPVSYQGELLQGFVVKNAPEFENWLESERFSAKDAYLRKLYEQMAQLPKDTVARKEECFGKYVKEDPLDERIYFLMMKSYQENQLYHKGIKIYQGLSRILNEELGIKPNQDITLLHRELLSGLTESSTESEGKNISLPVEGRSNELHFLTNTYHGFLAGRPAAVFLSGENGVGKTYLMNHFLDSLDYDSCLILRTICFQAEENFLLQPWNAILLQLDHYINSHKVDVPKRYLSTIANLFPLFGEQSFPANVPEDINISFNYRLARNTILKLFSIVGSEIPIVLSFDNVQFMDGLSRELLSLLIRDQNPNLMLLGTCLDILKPEVSQYINALVKERLAVMLQIRPFSVEDTYAYVEKRLGKDALNGPMLELIYKETQGNPFFLETILNNFTERSFQNVVSLRTQDILMDRLTELSTDSRQVLDVISLFHDYATLDTLEYILNRNTLDLLDILDDLKQHGLIEERLEDDIIQFRFRHSKMQEFVHAQLSPSKRRLLHTRVAAYMEQKREVRTTAWYQRLIYHYSICGNEAKVLKYRILELEIYSSYNYDLYPILLPEMESAATNLPRIEETFDELTAQLYRLYHFQPYAIDYSEAEARLLHLTGKYYISQGNYAKGVPAIQTVLTTNTYVKEHPDFHIQCLRQLTFYGIQIWDTGLMEENIMESIDLALANNLSTEYAIECRLYGLYCSMKGEYQRAKDYLFKAIDLFKSSPLRAQSYGLNIAACYNYLGDVQRRQGNYEVSLSYFEKAIETCLSRNCPVSATFYTNQARSLILLGRRQEAADVLKTACRFYDDFSTLMGRSIAKGYYSLIMAGSGQWDAAYQLLNDAMESAPRLSSPLELGILAKTKAELLHRYPERFSDKIPESKEECIKTARDFLTKIPGCQELNELDGFC